MVFIPNHYSSRRETTYIDRKKAEHYAIHHPEYENDNIIIAILNTVGKWVGNRNKTDILIHRETFLPFFIYPLAIFYNVQETLRLYSNAGT